LPWMSMQAASRRFTPLGLADGGFLTRPLQTPQRWRSQAQQNDAHAPPTDGNARRATTWTRDPHNEVSPGPKPFPRRIGRYVLYDEIALGGMGTVHLGRLVGPVGFARTVAIKCLHPHLARDPTFVTMFHSEARIASRVVHPNVVATLDVVQTKRELFLV